MLRRFFLLFQLSQIGIAAQLCQTRHDTLRRLIQLFRRDAIFSRGIHHVLDALLLFAQTLRVSVQTLLIMTQRVDRFL